MSKRKLKPSKKSLELDDSNPAHQELYYLEKQITPNLFKEDEKSLSFYVAPCESKQLITNIIVAGGGTVQKTCAPNVITLVEPTTDISAKIQGNCYSLEFIQDAVCEDKLPDLEKYLLQPKKRKLLKKDSLSSPRKRNKFTHENDERLAQFVKKHREYTPSSSRLWRLAELEDIAEGHTWQSMRSRYLKVVSSKFDLAYEGIPLVDDATLQSICASHTEDLAPESFNIPQINQNNDNSCQLSLNDNQHHHHIHEVDETTHLHPISHLDNSTLQNNNLLLLQMEHTKESVECVITGIMSITKLPKSIVIHGLIVNSGVVSDTIEYLQNPEEFYRTRAKANQIWSYAEDKSLLEKNKTAIEDLTRERGIEAIQKRQIFLES